MEYLTSELSVEWKWILGISNTIEPHQIVIVNVLALVQ